MNKTLTRNTLAEILDYAGIAAEDIVYGWESGATGYSGRYMYGDSCFALSSEDPGKVLEFFQGLGALLAEVEEAGREFPEGNPHLDGMAGNASADQLGRGIVYYFQGWKLEPEDGGE